MAGAELRGQIDDDETVEGTVEVGPNRVVVTGRRVLSFTPNTKGRNFRTVERPNVDGVGLRTRSNRRRFWIAAAAGVTALLFLAGWFLFDAAGLFPRGATGRGANALGMGGIVGQMRSLLGLVDALLLWGGILFVVVAVAFVGLYVRSRETVVAVDVAGGSNVDVPVDSVVDPREAVEELRVLLGFPTGYE
jgi:hypothetical protein